MASSPAFEAMANDEMGAFRRWLRSGALRSERSERNTFSARYSTTPACDYDTVALFHSSHANVQTSSRAVAVDGRVGVERSRGPRPDAGRADLRLPDEARGSPGASRSRLQTS